MSEPEPPAMPATTHPAPESAPPPGPPADLDAIEADLDAVETALDRLADDTYWTDEVTGAPIPDAVLDDDPTTRRAG